ncbi:MAG: GMP synthase (glutamine-hydrolyzing), partial [Aureibaculum sp.]|nr:GMP synthase (glutamine-hydrolyzing) [Aureibaculum sp.]
MQHKVLILDFGSQYTQLIARRVRELNIFCEIFPYNNHPPAREFKAVILSGSPFSVYSEGAPQPELKDIKDEIPLLGVCYGAQYLVYKFGGKVEPSKIREYGRANLSYIDTQNHLFDGISKGSQVWMSHGDTIVKLPDNFKKIASTDDVDNAA